MILYFLYRLGHALAIRVPIKISYKLASFLAFLYYLAASKDRKAVSTNMRIILGDGAASRDSDRMAFRVFQNFAKYLVDFFRFEKIDRAYIDKHVQIDGLVHIDKALSYGKGAIVLSAHLGNWELGGTVLPEVGYPLSAVVLTHQNKRINDFFRRQRLIGKMKPIEFGMTLKSCYRILKSNKLLALLGDRNFTKNGVTAKFFGKDGFFPIGPAVFSYRIGSPIVPSFMVREPGDTFRLIFEEPIMCTSGYKSEQEAIADITQKCVSVIEKYVRLYPDQWYIFKEIGKESDAKSMRPDTII